MPSIVETIKKDSYKALIEEGLIIIQKYYNAIEAENGLTSCNEEDKAFYMSQVINKIKHKKADSTVYYPFNAYFSSFTVSTLNSMKQDFEDAYNKSDEEKLYKELKKKYCGFILQLSNSKMQNKLIDLSKSLNKVFLVKYFSSSFNYPNTVEPFMNAYNKICDIFSRLSNSPSNYLLSILYSEQFISLYRAIFTQSKVVQNFFTRESNNKHLYNTFNSFKAILEDADKTQTFFYNFIHPCILPMTIKGFTNRTMQIFINLEGWTIKRAKTDDDDEIEPTLEEQKNVRLLY